MLWGTMLQSSRGQSRSRLGWEDENVMDCQGSEDDMPRETTSSSEEQEFGPGLMVKMEPPHDGEVKIPGEERVGLPLNLDI